MQRLGQNTGGIRVSELERDLFGRLATQVLYINVQAACINVLELTRQVLLERVCFQESARRRTGTGLLECLSLIKDLSEENRVLRQQLLKYRCGGILLALKYRLGGILLICVGVVLIAAALIFMSSENLSPKGHNGVLVD